MTRIVPVLIACSLAASGAALAQGTTFLNPNGAAVIAGPAPIARGAAAPGTRLPDTGMVGQPPVVGGADAGIAPMGTPPTVGNTALDGGLTPGGAPMIGGGQGQGQATGGTFSTAPYRAGQALAPETRNLTRSQAQARIRHDGFTEVRGLRQDSHGVWHGKAMKDGQAVSVALDGQGKILGK